MVAQSRYTRLIEKVFFDRYRPGDAEVPFERTDITKAAADLDITLPKNLGDVVYSMRYRAPLPDSVLATAPPERAWVIRPAGRAKYVFSLSSTATIVPRGNLAVTKIPDSTPGMIVRYALSDEQALLAKLRYNRLIDIFTGLTCYSLQSHLRTSVSSLGQVETDEVYVGVDREGAHYAIPVEAKGSSDQVGAVQIEQDFAMCEEKFPDLIVLPLAAQLLQQDRIALFSFRQQHGDMVVLDERHYALAPPEDLTDDELRAYARAATRASPR